MKHLLLCSLLISSFVLFGQEKSSWVYEGKDGKLVYSTDKNGNTIPDFSKCGYKKNNENIPIVPVEKSVSPIAGNNGANIQAAIDAVSALPLNSQGFRGAVLIEKGVYVITSPLKINTSGVVLRGEGSGPGGTVIIKSGTEECAIVEVNGGGDRDILEETGVQITEDYLPVGATSFKVKSAEGYNVGDKIVVYRPGTDAWIDDIGMNEIEDKVWEKPIKQWTPEGYSFYYEREITAIEKDKITIDVPVVMMIEAEKYTPGFIYKYEHINRIRQVGIESIRFESTFKSASDEAHADYAVSFDNIRDGWLRNLTGFHFHNGIVEVENDAKYITVTDCQAFEPISRIWGGRRYVYNIGGSMCLVKNCYSCDGRHDFVHGSSVVGPNAFVNCTSENAHEDSGPHHRWTTGSLYDNVKISGDYRQRNDVDLAVQDRGNSGSGHGWSGAQMVFWNVEADSIVCQAAPGTLNWCIGAIGGKHPGSYHDDRPEGIWEHHGTHVTPKSLFWHQLSDRLGTKFVSEKKPVSAIFARREDNYNIAINTIDGDTSSIWSAHGYDNEIRYDLEKATHVDFLKIAFPYGDKYQAVFEIQVSEDGSDWLTVFNGKSSGNTSNLEKYDVTDVVAQHIRIIGYGNMVTPENSISELEIWGNRD